MPMPSRCAVISIQASGLTGAQAPKFFFTTAMSASANPGQQTGGLYAAYWTLVCTAAAAGSAATYFTWYDANISGVLTATANSYLIGTCSIGASAPQTVFGLSASSVSAMMGGVQMMQCGSGASGVSAYLGYGISGNIGAGARWDCQLFLVDEWGV
jgi:hypothetical protein